MWLGMVDGITECNLSQLNLTNFHQIRENKTSHKKLNCIIRENLKKLIDKLKKKKLKMLH